MDGAKKRKRGGQPKHRPHPEDPPRVVTRRAKAEVDVLLGHCRQRPGEWVLLEVFKSARASTNRAGFYRRRSNGDGLWLFRASIRTNEFGEKVYGVYGRWMPNGE